MVYRTFEEKIEDFYELACKENRWRSVYWISKKLGYAHRKAVDEVVVWLAARDYIETTLKPRPQGVPALMVRPKVVPCEVVDHRKNS